MDNGKADLVIQYALAVAGEADEAREREMGPIHLLKYVYLADLASARESGASFTGASWRFHKFGPWSVEVFERIDPATRAIGARERRFPSSYKEEDGVRWQLCEQDAASRLEPLLPRCIAGAVSRAVHEHGNDTTSLLHYVYRTAPMLAAAPGELLDLKSEVGPTATDDGHEAGAPLPELSKTKIKKLKALVARRIEEKRGAKKLVAPEPAPRYDSVFERGQEWLDGLAGPPVEPTKGRLKFSKDIWKSSSRHEPEIP